MSILKLVAKGELSNPEVKAAKEGQVVFAGTCSTCGFGWHVVVKSPDGSVSLYAHMSSYSPDTGNYISRGQKIGVQGNSGPNGVSGGAVHLHFETFNRFPCDISNIVEKCFEVTPGGYLGKNANQYYKDSTMYPKFDECYTSSGLAATPGRCTNGYPTTLDLPLGSINTYITPPPTTYSKIMFRRKGTNQCIDIDAPYNNKKLYTWDCLTWNQNQKWEVIPKGNNEYQYRRLNTNQCMESYNPQTESIPYTWDCDNSAEQRFNYNWSTQNLFRVNALSNSQCVAKGGPSNGVTIKMYTCTAASGSDNFKWDIISVN